MSSLSPPLGLLSHSLQPNVTFKFPQITVTVPQDHPIETQESPRIYQDPTQEDQPKSDEVPFWERESNYAAVFSDSDDEKENEEQPKGDEDPLMSSELWQSTNCSETDETPDFSKKRVPSVEEIAEMHRFDSQLGLALATVKKFESISDSSSSAVNTDSTVSAGVEHATSVVKADGVSDVKSEHTSEDTSPPDSLYVSPGFRVPKEDLLRFLGGASKDTKLHKDQPSHPRPALLMLPIAPKLTTKICYQNIPRQYVWDTMAPEYRLFVNEHRKNKRGMSALNLPLPPSKAKLSKSRQPARVRPYAPSLARSASQEAPGHRRTGSITSLLDREGDVWGKFYSKYPDANALPWVSGSPENEEQTKGGVKKDDRFVESDDNSAENIPYPWVQSSWK